MLKDRFVYCFFMAILCVLPASGEAAKVELKNGDRLTGKIVEVTEEHVTLEIQTMGNIRIDRALIDETKGDLEQYLDEIRQKMLEKDKEEIKKIKFSGKIEAGFDRRRGNTNTTELYGDIALKAETQRTETRAESRAFYASEDRKMNAQKSYGLLRHDRSFGEEKRVFAFLSAEVDRDRFANIDIRFIPTAGAGYKIFDRERTQLTTELGIGTEHTRFRDDTEDTDELVLVPRLYFEQTVFEKSTISEEITLYPSLTNSGEFRLRSETVLAVPMSDRISIQFKFIDEYNSMPGGDTKKNDIRILSTLGYQF